MDLSLFLDGLVTFADGLTISMGRPASCFYSLRLLYGALARAESVRDVNERRCF